MPRDLEIGTGKYERLLQEPTAEAETKDSAQSPPSVTAPGSASTVELAEVQGTVQNDPQQVSGLTCLRPQHIPPLACWLTAGAKDLKKNSGKYYHEVCLGSEYDWTECQMSLGWFTEGFNSGRYDGKGIGDDKDGWATNGSPNSSSWPRYWRAGDIIGCAVDLDSSVMKFALNGEWIASLTVDFDRRGQHLFPGVSACGDFALKFSRSTWTYEPPSEDYAAWSDHDNYKRPQAENSRFYADDEDIVRESEEAKTDVLAIKAVLNKASGAAKSLTEANQRIAEVFQKVDVRLRENKEALLDILKTKCQNFYVSSRGEWVHSSCAMCLQHACMALRCEREVVLAAVRGDGNALQFAMDALKAEREVVTEAVKRDGRALQFAAEPLKADKEVVMAAVARTGTALQFAAEPLKADKEVVTKAVGQDGLGLRFAAEPLKADGAFESRQRSGYRSCERRRKGIAVRRRAPKKSSWPPLARIGAR
eukprot:TRINITY_DN6870_c0_g1_i12.p1 TRINITY_DN6870_c0_g1~~TRINITY_DN6870_c0_g1_i12.p1  ORF type:complete len:478 (+),score=75.81 TRINITY_DN6870_c0_g1_i12:123-1556(+)